jgi:hypothetical protein
MPIEQTPLLPPEVLQEDHEAILAISSLPNYSPYNSNDSAPALKQLDTQCLQLEQELQQLHQAYEAGRERLIAAAWARHHAVLRAKLQVIAQYGADSCEVQAIGLKRRSERKRSVRKLNKTTSTSTI